VSATGPDGGRQRFTRPPEPEPGAISGPPAPGSAGLVVRFDEDAARAAGVPALAWIPATTARRVAHASSTTTLGESNGISLGLAHVEGRLLTLVAFGKTEPHAPVVLCARPEADLLAVAVTQIVASGRFDDADDGAVMVSGERAAALDVVAITSRLEAAFWIADATPERASIVPRSKRS
jgi:hypothetical protein